MSNIKLPIFFTLKNFQSQKNNIEQEINKIIDFDTLEPEVKKIINKTLQKKNDVINRKKALKNKNQNLKLAQTYFDLTDVQIASNFNKANDQLIDLITEEISKINNYDDLSEEVKAIIDHDDNSELKNALNEKITELETKKTNLKLAKTYFDLVIKEATTFIKANTKTIDLIDEEIKKNNFNSLTDEVKAIVEHNDNSDLKNALNEKITQLETKKTNLELAKAYFDLVIKEATTFTKTNDQTITLINQEINKINDYDDLSEDVKVIVEHDDNSELKDALNEKITELETKKTNLESAKSYFDLDIESETTFTEANTETINSISDEINKGKYNDFSNEVKEIIDHDDNSDLKNALNIRLQELETKKTNLGLAKTYFDLVIKPATTFTKAIKTEIDLITDEINKNNYNSLTPEAKAIINHDDNSDLKNAFDQTIESLKAKKTHLTKAKAYFDLVIKKASTFTEANTETINSIQDEINKNNFDSLTDEVKAIVEHDDNSELKGALNEKITELETKKTHLIKTKGYFDLTDVQNASTFTKANTETIESIQTEINKKNYDDLTPEAKAIVDHDDNSELKDALNEKITELETKKTNLESAKTYLNLKIKKASTFTEATKTKIDLITDEINKNNYNSLTPEAKAIIDHDDNSDLKSPLTNKIKALETKKTNLELAKIYLNLKIKEASTFTKSNTETINLINEEIKKNNFNSLIDEVKAIVEHNDNSEYKNALNIRLQELEEKKANLLLSQIYFDLTNVQDASFFNKADQTTIDLITIEIEKINDYDNLSDDVKTIVNHDDNVEHKVSLNVRLQELNLKKTNLESTKAYFDLTRIKDASFFNKVDNKTINLITIEIKKDNYNTLTDEVKAIVDHDDNSVLKSALTNKIKALETKKTNLELAKGYFDLTDVQNASFFNKADQTIDLITTEIEKINDYDNLSDDVKTIVNHDDNVEHKVSLNVRLQELNLKKTNLESAKAYFDLTRIKDASFFNKVDNKTINLITIEIKKDNYNTLTDEVKAIVDHDDNSVLKSALTNKIKALETKKTNLELAKGYFDLTDVQNASFFNKADQTIDLITTEIEKINDYDSLSEGVKAIVDHDDNSELKEALNEKTEQLETKKTHLTKAKGYFDLTDVQNASTFTKANTETIESIQTEINKKNYDDLTPEAKAIVDHDDNSELKDALNEKIIELETKKANLESAKTYLNLKIKKASTFTEATKTKIDLITDEIKKDNYNTLTPGVKAIVDHDDNSEYKNAIDQTIESLKAKKTHLIEAKAYFDLVIKEASTFTKANTETIESIQTEINKKNYGTSSPGVKAIVDHDNNSVLKSALTNKIKALETKKTNLELAQTYFDLTNVQNPSIFNKADQTTIDLINQEINKINDYDNLSDDVKTIVNHDDNVEHKVSLNVRLQELNLKKTNLESAKAYFDLTRIKDASFFNKVDNKTINLITIEIKKDNYNTLTDEVKAIVDHDDNSDLKNAFDQTIESLKAKKTHLTKAKAYFDLTDVQNASFFNKADQTIDLITTEIEKINDYDSLSEGVKAIVDHDDNSELKGALNEKITELETKKTNLESAKAYLNLKIKEASTFTKSNTETINLINEELKKNNFNSLIDEVKAIVEHNDNSEYKNALNIRLQELEEKKANLLLSQIYFDLTDVQNASFFNKADQTIDLITTEIEKINDYDSLSEGVKAIVDHDDNSELKGALNEKITELETKKTNLESAKTYLNLKIKKASTFTKSNTETINLINEEIKKNNFNSLTDEVKAIVEHNDNSEYKNALNIRLQELEEKKANLLLSQIYFDLTNVQDASFFNKANQTTINLINEEINKINDYDSLSEGVKAIVDHNDNLEYKNALQTRLQELKTKKTNLELAKAYFDLNIESETTFTEANTETIDLITDEIDKNNYNSLTPEVKAIVDHDDNSNLKDAFDQTIESLKAKKTHLIKAKAYFDLDILEASTFTKANTKTIDLITDEINKDNFDSLTPGAKAIVDHDDNSDLKNALNEKIAELETKKKHLIETYLEIKAIINHDDNSDLKNALINKFEALKTKKTNLELAKAYFDLTDVQNASFFNKADQTITLINQEINKINDYDSLSEEVKAIVDHNDNLEYKNALQTRLENLQTKKANLELAKAYFDLNIESETTFIKANTETIDLIDEEIKKNNFNSLTDEVKAIVEHNDNSEYKNALNTRLQELETKKTNLESAKSYFDLDILEASTFTKANTETIESIQTEINKKNYDDLTPEAKAIVNHDDNSELKDALNEKIAQLETKKTNLESAKAYFDLVIKEASTFTKANTETIDLITDEINKDNFDSLTDKTKAIVDHDDNSDLKNALNEKIAELETKKTHLTETYLEIKAIVNHDDNSELKDALNEKIAQLETKKTNLESAKSYFDLSIKPATKFIKANTETIKSITTEIEKINNYDDLAEEVKAIIDHDDNSILKSDLKNKIQKLKTKKINLESAKTYFDLTNVQDASNFNKADDQTIDLITDEINKINDYNDLSEDVKAIVDHDANLEYKNALNTKLQELQKSKINLELQKLVLSVNSIDQEINKILNEDDDLFKKRQTEIVDHDNNSELRKSLQNPQPKKTNFELAQTYSDQANVQNASFFNKADDRTIDLIDQEINIINDYDSLSEEAKTIVNQETNSEFNNLLQTKLQDFRTKKTNLKLAKAYFDLNIEDASNFNEANDATINLIRQKINKINDYDNFSEEVKAIVDHDDNSEFKKNLFSYCWKLKVKKRNLKFVKTYFDLTGVQNPSNFDKADDVTINLIDQEIKKINDFDNLSQDVKEIVNHDDNSEYKNTLNTRLQELTTKKTDLELAQMYFDLTDVQDLSNLNKIDDQTINLINQEITKIDNYDNLSQDVKAIVDHKINSDLKILLQTRLHELQTKKANFEFTKNYFDLSNVKNSSSFNKADQTTIDSIDQEIEKINDYNDLSEDVKAIVDHDDNSKFKNLLQTKLQELISKKRNLELAKTYFDLDIKEASTFTKANTETIESINQEINKISDNYNNLSEKVKAIVNHDDNSDSKNALTNKFEALKTKKTDLISAKTYFDLTDVKNSSIFNKADQTTIDLITDEINKINDYDDLSEEIKAIVNHQDNSNFKNTLQTRLQNLQDKKENLKLAKKYLDVQIASSFNKADDQTIDLITTEINKINDYDNLSNYLKAIINHEINSEFNNLLQTRLEKLQEKKANLELAKTYFDLTNVQDASNFNRADQKTIVSITIEINKINNEHLFSEEVKTIVDHIDNSGFKSLLKAKLKELWSKKLNLKKAKKYLDVKDTSFFKKIDIQTIESITDEIKESKNFSKLPGDVKVIINHIDNLDLKSTIDQKIQALQDKKETLIQDLSILRKN